jgi:predicted nuclease with TOPRIM domain
VLTHDQVTAQLKRLGAEKTYLREQMGLLQQEAERINQRAAQLRAAMAGNEANARLVSLLLQESAKSEEFDQPAAGQNGQPSAAPTA